MTSSPVNLFNIGKSGLMVSKHSMQTTGHNIANVNTEGYSRQRVDQTQGPTIPVGKLTFGTGATAKQISRVNDDYLNRRIELENRNFGQLDEKSTYLHQTESIFNESNSDGLNRIATKFFNEFRKLSTDPGNAAIRASVRESSTQLVADIHRMNTELREVQKNIDDRITGYVREVNALAKEVAHLNEDINRAEGGGGFAPDLHDKRDLALKKLGAMGQISVSEDNNGRYLVTMEGHIPLVVGGQVNELQVLRTPADPNTGKEEERLDIASTDKTPVYYTEKITHGKLGGLLEVRDKDILAAKNNIDSVAYNISKGVNEIHRQGYGLDGISGRNFFKEPMGQKRAAEMMDIDPGLTGNLDAIAAAKDPNAPGDNRIAVALSGLSSMKGLTGENTSILDTYNSMVSEVAVKTAAAEKSLTFQRDVLSQLENVRDSITGVSLDEETTNLVQFQHAYAANAKVLQTADENLNTILNLFK